MVLKCLHYNNTENICRTSYSDCARQIECLDGGHCFRVWQVDGIANNTLSAGCNPPYPSSPDECPKECIGQTKGSKYYCCCKGNLCNMNFTLPIQKREDVSKPKEAELDANNASNMPWTVIPIVIMITLVGAYVYWSRRVTNKNRTHHNQSINNLKTRELNELRNNNDVHILTPFRDYHNHHHDSVVEDNNKQQNDKIDLSSIRLLEIIGSGRFGTVHRATLDNSEIAVKIMPSIEHQSWLNEQQIYKWPRVKHENILNFLYSDEHIETETYWLVVEYASKGSLYSFLKDNVIDWKEFHYIALGIVRGLSHLHEAGVAHRDFKSKNVLLKDDMTPLVTDFGVAAILDTSTGSQLDHRKKYLQVGTPRYMAPEVLECSVTFTKASFFKIDVYALSLVLWELISRTRVNFSNSSSPLDPPPYKLPFEDLAGPQPDINKMRQIVVEKKCRPTLESEWREYPASEFCRALEDGWEYDHDARISASCFVERVESLPQSI